MRNLQGGYCFTKVDLADAYKHVKLDLESQKRLALSSHQGVLIQMRKLAPGYFQEIIEQLTKDLRGVAVYVDDVFISGNNAQ